MSLLIMPKVQSFFSVFPFFTDRSTVVTLKSVLFESTSRSEFSGWETCSLRPNQDNDSQRESTTLPSEHLVGREGHF